MVRMLQSCTLHLRLFAVTHVTITTIGTDNVRAAQIILVVLRVALSSLALSYDERSRKYTQWISAGPGLIAYLEIHLRGSAWDGVYEKKAQSSWEVPAHSHSWYTARPFTSSWQLWPLNPSSSSWLSSVNTQTQAPKHVQKIEMQKTEFCMDIIWLFQVESVVTSEIYNSVTVPWKNPTNYSLSSIRSLSKRCWQITLTQI